jgi:hypothetical protein
MKKTVYILLITSLLLSCGSMQNQLQNLPDVAIEINRIRNDILPDSRDAILEVYPEKRGEQLYLLGRTDKPFLKDSLLHKLNDNRIVYVDSIRILPEKKFKNITGVTRLSVANLRAEPKHSAELVTQTLMGMPLVILDEQDDFYRVKTPEAYYAWVDKAGVQIMDKQAYDKWKKIPKIIITSFCGKILQKPDAISKPVSDFVMNDVFGLISEQETYSLVQYPDGRKGYVNNENFIKLDEFSGTNRSYASPFDVVNFARDYLGIPYLWGGTSVKGLDCSGFTKSVYAHVGFLLPRDASQQVKIGKPLTITDDFKYLQPGDLLFFGRIENGKEKITHVAIHIDKGRIIHATGEVKIESLNPKDKDYNPVRRKSLLQARRIFENYPQNFDKIYR